MKQIRDVIRERCADRSVVLLGFGREGQSTYHLLRQVFPLREIAIADMNEALGEDSTLRQDPHVTLLTGPDYLQKAKGFEVIFRSPGIPVWKLIAEGLPIDRFTSQTDIFLQCYSDRTIGVTGTKGKSTTSSLIHHIFKTAGRDAILAGNIGNPVFHFADLMGHETTAVLELSSHQLEILTNAPHISVFLNLYQEHLDAYESYGAYQLAKANIVKMQQEGDTVIYPPADLLVTQQIAPFLGSRRPLPFSLDGKIETGSFIADGTIWFSDGADAIPVWKIHQDRFLRGDHNLKNIMAAINAAMASGIDVESVQDGIATFKGLEHRLEYVGKFNGIHFYNDSIATIPEACMEAVKAVPMVDTLIAGGFDRGIDYAGLAEFLAASEMRNLILVGEAGRRIMEHLADAGAHGKRLFFINRFDDCADIAFRETRPGYACLLSPAAASYDEFRNFEERGKRFRALVSGVTPSVEGRPTN